MRHELRILTSTSTTKYSDLHPPEKKAELQHEGKQLKRTSQYMKRKH